MHDFQFHLYFCYINTYKDMSTSSIWFTVDIADKYEEYWLDIWFNFSYAVCLLVIYVGYQCTFRVECITVYTFEGKQWCCSGHIHTYN